MNVELIILIVVLVLGLVLLYLLLYRGFNNLANEQKQAQEKLFEKLADEFRQERTEVFQQFNQLREDLREQIKDSNEMLAQTQKNISELQQTNLNNFSQRIADLDLALNKNFQNLRLEINEALKNLNNSLTTGQSQSIKNQGEQFVNFGQNLQNLAQNINQNSNSLREIIDKKLADIQNDNNQKLEKMRETVEEKLQGTLEKRLSESFGLVSKNLQDVQQGLGEMKSLASGVGDLKSILTNVKMRGTWGEMQLGNLLEQVLTPEQFSANVNVNPNSKERVDFAIKLPGKNKLESEVVWLPIDAKFPKEDYERLVQFSQESDVAGVETATRALMQGVIKNAKSINEKYINPPNTTDFAVMYLPSEGLYAEVLKIPGFAESIQNESRILIASPTTLSALLNALQVGFYTLKVEKKSSEIWNKLSEVKKEFGLFGDLLENVKKKISEAGNSLDKASQKSRTIERQLRNVDNLEIGNNIVDSLPPASQLEILESFENIAIDASAGVNEENIKVG